MLRTLENFIHIARFHNAPEVHNDHAIADVAHDVEVVRDEKHRHLACISEVVEQFKEGELDEVYVIYTYMKSSITTEVDMINLLPITRDMAMQHEMERQGVFNEEIELQPSPNALLNNIVPDVIMGYIYGALMESFCSEQNARMSAMQVANDSAAEMIRNLSIEYNRARQSMITQEITEVIAGAKAQKKKKKARKEVM